MIHTRYYIIIRGRWKIERRKSGVCGEVLNRWLTGDGGEGNHFLGESAAAAVELERQRLGYTSSVCMYSVL